MDSDLKYAESVAISAKLEYADLATEKDLYEFKYKRLLNDYQE
jgi:hypothetical protein